MSYLDGSFLADGEGYDAGDATVALYPALGDQPPADNEVIVLPGGIVLPKRTVWMILGALAIAALVLYLKRKNGPETKRIEG